MSAYENRQRQAALAGIMGSYAGGLGNQAGAAMAGTASNMAQAMAMEEYQKEQEKKEKSGKLGKLGSIVGGVAGSLIPGVGPVLGPAIGSALGGTAGHLAGGSKLDLGTTLGYGAQGAIGGMLMPAGAGAGNVLKQGVAQAPAMIAKPGASTMATPAPTVTNPLPQVTGPIGNNTVLAPSTPPAVPYATGTPAAQPGRLGGFFSNPTSGWRGALTGMAAAHGGFGQMGSGIGQTPPPPGYAYNQNGELVPIGG
jgi:hypothetical protein